MTTNHPANGPVSLERLHQIREILSKAAAQSDGGNIGYAMADAVKVIDGVISAFGAKLDENGLLPCPLCGGGAEFDYDDDNLNWISCSVCGISTDTVYHTDIDARDKLREVWNSRASMLQAGNSPVTPDGWQLVPKEPTEAMNKAGWAAINEHDAINPTYRAMLAAAPQQDVRLALEIGMSRYAGAMQKLVDSGD
ncbi:Lar family restriction alleviation protein [Citrobacter portucalensis]